MNTVKLTAANVRTLPMPPGKSDHFYWDSDVPGLGLRLRGGQRTLCFQYKLGSTRRITLGAVSGLDFPETRKTAERLYARVKLGEDPAADKADAKIRAAETVGAIAPRFLEYQRLRLRPDSYSEVERHVLIYAKALHPLQLAKVERRDVATVLAAITAKNGATTANRVRTSLSAFYSWAMTQGLADGNAVAGTARNIERSRERVLEPAELALIWNHLGDNTDHYSAIIRLLALTAARADEIAALRWSELRDNTIVLPSSRTKNARVHIIPLSRPARGILEGQLHRTNTDGRPRDLIFGIGAGGFNGWAQCKNRLNERIAKATGKPLAHWTPHDLRRSAATHMAGLDIAPHVIECILGHVGGFRAGVHGIYNRNSYEREKTIALDLWAERLMAIVEGRESNVVPLRQA